jgi:hypothetical protein
MGGKGRFGAVVLLAIALPAGRAQAKSEPGTLASGNGTSCFMSARGDMWCWGRNDAGQLGDGTTIDRLTPIFEGGSMDEIAAGDRNVCRFSSAGAAPSLACAGANEFGQIGDGTTIERHAFTPVNALGGQTIVGLTAGDTPCATNYIANASPGNQTYCWGSNQFGSVGDGTTTDRSSPVPIFSGGFNPRTSGGGGHACVTTSAFIANWCWGNNVDDALGLGAGAGSMSTVPVHIVSLPSNVFAPTDLAIGVHHDCFISGLAVWCWGLNDHGQLGDGTTVSSSVPVQVLGIDTSVWGPTAVWVSPSGGFSCAVVGDTFSAIGQAYCWGRNDRGQLGDGTTTERHVAALVVGLDNLVGQVVPGEDHACAYSHDKLSATELVRCWGANDHGQMGDGTTTDRPTPVSLTFTKPAVAVPALGGLPSVALVIIFAAAGALAVNLRRRRRLRETSRD